MKNLHNHKSGIESTSEMIPLMDHWYRFTLFMFGKTEKFPKSARFTISSRIDNYLLDGIECIIEAQYTKNTRTVLPQFNLLLEKLRFLTRISFERRYLASGDYRRISEYIVEAGKQAGGWLKSEDSDSDKSI